MSPLNAASRLATGKFEEPRTLREQPHTNARRARTAFAALSVAGLLALLVASGCINESPSHEAADNTADSAPARAHKASLNLKAAIPAPGDVLIAGGADASNQSIADAEFFDPSLGQFVLTGTASSSRAGVSAAPLSPTQVLFAGGFSGRATIRNFSLNLDGRILSSAESFDETTGA